MHRITVFTPTYNRGKLLKKGYEALLRQDDKRFEWLIVDDGSQDNTKEIVQNWIQEGNIEIRYIYKENGGLHTAYNTAIANINTELAVCVDSDDYLTEHAISNILNVWDKSDKLKYAGIVGLDCDMTGKVIGDKLPEQKSVNLIDLLVGKYKLKNGDRKVVVRTELYKKYAPMKTFNGEKNFNPHYMHLQISLEYDFLVFNHILCVVDYKPDGMSAGIFRQYYNSPNSFLEIRRLYMNFKQAGINFKIKQAIHYDSSCFLAHRKKNIVINSPCVWLTTLMSPLGWCLSKFIKIKVKGTNR